MNQKQLETTIRQALVEMLAEQEVALPVSQAYPSAKQGRVDDGIYFYLLSKGKRGWQYRDYQTVEDDLVNQETQINEFMFQFQAFVQDNGKADGQLLAEDVLSIVRGVLQSLKFVEQMQAQGIGVQRATEIVTPTFVNELDNFEHEPNFTVIFTHNRTLQVATPVMSELEINTHLIK